jgi:hypothetical protein
MHELSDEDFKEVNIHVSMSNYKHAWNKWKNKSQQRNRTFHLKTEKI